MVPKYDRAPFHRNQGTHETKTTTLGIVALKFAFPDSPEFSSRFPAPPGPEGNMSGPGGFIPWASVCGHAASARPGRGSPAHVIKARGMSTLRIPSVYSDWCDTEAATKTKDLLAAPFLHLPSSSLIAPPPPPPPAPPPFHAGACAVLAPTRL